MSDPKTTIWPTTLDEEDCALIDAAIHALPPLPDDVIASLVSQLLMRSASW